MNQKKMIATFSWDDGHPLDLRIAQLFQHYELSCTFYIPKTNSENLPTLSSGDLKALSLDGFDIHSHTLNHVYLKGKSANEQFNQIKAGKDYVEETIGKEDDIFCYPGGKYDLETTELVKKAGFKYARTIDLGYKNCLSDNNYELPTTMIISPLTVKQIAKHVLKRHRIELGLSILKMNKAIVNSKWNTEGLNKLSENALHFWGHSWEIEKYNLWGQLENLIKKLIANDTKIICNKQFYEQRSY